MVNAFAPSGLLLDVYRCALYPDATLGGVSGAHDRLTLVGFMRDSMQVATPLPAGSRVFQERDNAPAVALRHTGYIHGQSTTAVCLVPVRFDDNTGEYRAEDAHVMAGGNYAGLSDSRFSALVHEMLGRYHYGLIAVHDRIER